MHESMIVGNGKVVETADLTLDARMQSRVKVSNEAIEEYAEQYVQYGIDALPPIEVVLVKDNAVGGSVAYVADGWHRVLAAAKAKLLQLRANVHEGDEATAKLKAAGANQGFGIRRTNADKRRAVMMALATMQSLNQERPVREVADLCGVTRQFVYSVVQQDEAARREIENAAMPVYEKERTVVEVADGEESAAVGNNSVEERMQEAKKVLGCTIALLRSVEHEVEQLFVKYEAAAVYLNRQVVIADLKNATSAVRRASPHSICPVCGGGGCAACHQVGWVSLQQYKLIPASQREGNAAT